MRYFYTLFYFTCVSFSLFAQVGIPPMVSLGSDDYNGSPEVRAIMQSKRGFLYVASSGGVISEYDGSSWNSIPIPCRHPNVLEEDENGNIFFSGSSYPCVGYLRPSGKAGKWEVVNVDISLPDSVVQHEIVRIRIYKVNGRIYAAVDSEKHFSTQKPLIYQFKDEKFEPLLIQFPLTRNIKLLENGILNTSNAKNIYIYDYQGNMKDSLFLPNAKKIYRVEDLGQDQILILSLFDNIWKYDLKTRTLTPFVEPKHMKEIVVSKPLNISRLNNGNIVIGTIKNGFFIFNKNGNLLQHLSTKEGLRDDVVMGVTQDNRNQLWVGLYNGVNRVDISSPVSSWAKENGVLGNTTEDVLKFQGTYFATTVSHIIYLDTLTNSWVSLAGSTVENFIAGALTLSDQQEHLFIGHSNGLSEVYKDKKGAWALKPVVHFDKITVVSDVFNHSSDLDKIYAYGEGVFSFNYHSPEKITPLIPKYKPVSIWNTSFANDILWVISEDKRCVGLQIPDEETIEAPDSMFVVHIDQQTFFIKSNIDSVFTFQRENNQRIYDPKMTRLLKPYVGKNIHIVQDSLGAIWVFDPNAFLVNIYRKTSNGYKRDIILEQALSKYNMRQVYSDPDDFQIAWVSTSKGILKVDMSKSSIMQTSSKDTLRTYIRQVSIGKDSLILDGNFVTKKVLQNDSIAYIPRVGQLATKTLELGFKTNSIAFQVAMPFFVEEKKIVFSYFLEGLDTEWSPWTKLNIKEYAHLPTGKYIFKVKAKNYLGQESEITQFRFNIYPPWYRSRLAYFIYILLILAVFQGLNRIYIRRLRKQKEFLEEVVKRRTNEIMQANAELQQQNEEILQQRDQLHETKQQIIVQNNKILASINYAKNIQIALLPYEDRLKREIPNHFIFYRPRNIVSGDFYWVEKINSKRIIVISDCTGHGVPGAFMSMLGSSGLSDTVFQQRITKPNLILQNLHDYIYKALKQDQSENRDGMDIAVLVWDEPKKYLEFAGAMNPMYYVKENRMIQVKADKIPIGGKSIKSRVYKTHRINIVTPLMIYLATDGYQDQFGGEEGKKFMTKNFRELLFQISHLPLQDQRNHLDDALRSWMGENDQVDDILVFGMKIS